MYFVSLGIVAGIFFPFMEDFLSEGESMWPYYWLYPERMIVICGMMTLILFGTRAVREAIPARYECKEGYYPEILCCILPALLFAAGWYAIFTWLWPMETAIGNLEFRQMSIIALANILATLFFFWVFDLMPKAVVSESK